VPSSALSTRKCPENEIEICAAGAIRSELDPKGRASGEPVLVRLADLGSSGDGVLAQQPTEAVDPLDLRRVVESSSAEIGDGNLEIDPAVRPCCVVVLDEHLEHAFEMTFVPDEQPIETLASSRAHEPFGIRVGSRCSHGCLDYSSAQRSHYFVEGSNELRVSISDQELDGAALLVERRCQIAGASGDPAGDGMLGDASQETLRRSRSIKKST
jgi:hypothetical protein